MKIGILGCGNWGSVFGIIQSKNNHQVKIWEFEKARAQKVQRTRDNRPFLYKYKIPRSISISSDLEYVLKDVDLVVFAVPCQVLQSVITRMEKISCSINAQNYLSLVKGIDKVNLKRPSQLIARLPNAAGKISVLSGPSIANEIVREEPTAVVLVGQNAANVRKLQSELTTPSFRIYEASDMIGVELGGAMKNVLALACGISDGLGFGSNAKGALISRGILEIQRLGIKMGARQDTFWGLSGLGDLITTSFSEESRNHRFGFMIGRGSRPKTAFEKFPMVAEGVPTALAVNKLAKKYNVETPICRVVYDILYGNKSSKQCLKELMGRPLIKERVGIHGTQ